jgi:hypothetical protein
MTRHRDETIRKKPAGSPGELGLGIRASGPLQLFNTSAASLQAFSNSPEMPVYGLVFDLRENRSQRCFSGLNRKLLRIHVHSLNPLKLDIFC